MSKELALTTENLNKQGIRNFTELDDILNAFVNIVRNDFSLKKRYSKQIEPIIRLSSVTGYLAFKERINKSYYFKEILSRYVKDINEAIKQNKKNITVIVDATGSYKSNILNMTLYALQNKSDVLFVSNVTDVASQILNNESGNVECVDVDSFNPKTANTNHENIFINSRHYSALDDIFNLLYDLRNTDFDNLTLTITNYSCNDVSVQKTVQALCDELKIPAIVNVIDTREILLLSHIMEKEQQDHRYLLKALTKYIPSIYKIDFSHTVKSINITFELPEYDVYLRNKLIDLIYDICRYYLTTSNLQKLRVSCREK